jgi:O-succinylbenzoate synthase
MASGAVRDAVLDLGLRRAGEGPASVLGPLAPSVAFGVAVGLADEVASVVEAAGRARDAGAALVVLKVRPGWCEAPVASVRRAHPDLAVGVDANASFTTADLDELRAADAHGLALVEQPMAADDHAGAARAVSALEAPVSLDEAVASPGDLEAALVRGTGSMVTVKPARLGGVEAAARVAGRAAAAGWGVHVGGMLESGLGRAAARAVAARPEVTGASLVGPTALLFPDDVVEPIAAGPDGTVAVATGPGLAPAPDPDRLTRLTVDRWTGADGSGGPGPTGPVGR